MTLTVFLNNCNFRLKKIFYFRITVEYKCKEKGGGNFLNTVIENMICVIKTVISISSLQGKTCKLAN